jgi:hypothetical protein
MQTPLLGFRPTRQGLFVPDPVGLAGFTRQTMAQTKKSVGPTFIGMASSTGAGSALVMPQGAGIGDLLIYFGNANSNPVTPGNAASWSTLSSVPGDVGGNYLWKRADATDFQQVVGSGTNPAVTVWAFRNVVSPHYVTGEGNSDGWTIRGDTFSVAGFTKNAKAVGLLFLMIADGTVQWRGVSAPADLIMPSRGFAYVPADRIPVPSGPSYPRQSAYTMSPQHYVNGANVTMIIPGAWSQAVVAVIELRGA